MISKEQWIDATGFVEWNPGRLVSLWDMLKFQAARFIQIVRLLSLARAFCEERIGNQFPAKAVEEVRDDVSKLVELCDQVDLPMTRMAAEALLERLVADRVEMSEGLVSAITAVESRLEDELSLRLTYHVAQERARYLGAPSVWFSQDALTAFPSTVYDVEEAGRCFALGQNTACVFHLMRVLEVGVRQVSRGLGIPDPIKDGERNWGRMLRKVEERIAFNEKTPPPSWPSEKLFFEKAHASLDAVRNAWRNATMHVENKYDAEEAEHILMAVKGFMKQLAGRLSE